VPKNVFLCGVLKTLFPGGFELHDVLSFTVFCDAYRARRGTVIVLAWCEISLSLSFAPPEGSSPSKAHSRHRIMPPSCCVSYAQAPRVCIAAGERRAARGGQFSTAVPVPPSRFGGHFCSGGGCFLPGGPPKLVKYHSEKLEFVSPMISYENL